MLLVERIHTIKQMLGKQESVSIPELSRLFGVSGETIRRDLEKICQEDPHVVRVYGGAYRTSPDQDPPYKVRKGALVDEKRRIAGGALQLLDDRDCIMMDSSTTALNLAHLLGQSKLKLTVITNSLSIVNELCEDPDIKIVNVGGTYNANSCSFRGNISVAALQNFHADKAFVSCSGVSLEFGATDNSEDAALIRRTMLANATRRILLADSNKFDRCKTNKIADTAAFHAVVTNKEPGPAWRELFEGLGIELYVC